MDPTPRLRYRPSQRLHIPSEYEAVFSAKHSAGDAVLLVFVTRAGSDPARLGTSVGKRCGNSVKRHLLKRYIREAFRLHQLEWPAGLTCVVVPRPGVTPTLGQVSESLQRLIPRALRKLPLV
jgi:ribonuclease P protein component